MIEIGDALRQYMLPFLDLKAIVQLAGSCRSWQHLIAHTSLHQLPDSARQALLPPDLTSDLPLLQLVRQQAQLLGRLQGRDGFSPCIQHLSFDDDLDERQQGSNLQDTKPTSHFQNLLWSPCTRLEDSSRWLALDPISKCKREPSIIDIGTGRQIRLKGEACLPTAKGTTSEYVSPLHPTWLSDGRCLLLCLQKDPFPQPVASTEMCLVDACSQRILPVNLQGAMPTGIPHFFTACRQDGCAQDIFAWVASPLTSNRLQNHISVYDVDSWQLLYQLSCPENVLHTCSQQHSMQGSPGLRGACTQINKHWKLEAHALMLSPDQQLLAVVWWLWDKPHALANLPVETTKHSKSTSLSIYRAVSGVCQYSTVLTCRDAKRFGEAMWLPCSSNFMYTKRHDLHLISSTGQRLWSSFMPDRSQDLAEALTIQAEGHPYIRTDSQASPCGRWILVTDNLCAADFRNGYSELHASILDASTGSVLSHAVSLCPWRAYSSWSTSGTICLIPEASMVLAVCKDTKTFQQMELQDEDEQLATFSPGYDGILISPCPCGNVIIGRES